MGLSVSTDWKPANGSPFELGRICELLGFQKGDYLQAWGKYGIFALARLAEMTGYSDNPHRWHVFIVAATLGLRVSFWVLL